MSDMNNLLDPSPMRKQKEEDEKMLTLWRSIAVVGIKNMLPLKLRPLLKFNTWEEAMRLLIKRDLSQGK